MNNEKPQIDYEVVERIALIKEDRDNRHRIELNRIKWNKHPPVFDLRVWVKGEDGNYKPTSKGVRMYYDDVLMLSKVLVDL